VNSFVADFVGSTNFLEGSVLGPDGAEGHYRVAHADRRRHRARHRGAQGEDKVLVSVRPEDVELVEAKPQNGNNVWRASSTRKVFLGECVDFQVKLGERMLMSRRHPSLRTPIGHSIFVQLPPEKCVALKAVLTSRLLPSCKETRRPPPSRPATRASKYPVSPTGG